MSDLEWRGGVRLRPCTIAALVDTFGGEFAGDLTASPVRIAPIAIAGHGDLAPLVARRFVRDAAAADARGALLLVDRAFAGDSRLRGLRRAFWIHPHSGWALAELLDRASDPPELPPVVHPTAVIGEHVVIAPRVVVGARVVIGAGSVVGRPGFGWAMRGNETRSIPQLGGVVIDDDAAIGALCTIDAGTLTPTRIRRGAKLDAHVHVGHNCDIGEGALIAAQCGFAGSVTVGKGVRIGGQVGVADHVRVGDYAQIAAKSGVIGDIPSHATVAGYPAVTRSKWLRGLARLYALGRSSEPRSTTDDEG